MRNEHRSMNLMTYRMCFDICDDVRMKRAGKRIDVHDYPAAVASCASSWDNYNLAVTKTSGKVVKTSYGKTPELGNALTVKLGIIGTNQGLCKNYIGACAEPHAAREVIKENPNVKVNDLVFSYAYRPRTKSVIRYCKNCLEVFNVQNP